MDILQLSVSASVMIVAVVVIRALTLHRLPKRTFLVLWGVVVCRLLIPFSIPSRFSFYTGIDRLKRMFAESAVIPSSPAVITSGANTANIAAAGETIGIGAPTATAAISVSPIEIAWFAGMCACALIFIAAYIKCRREFKTSLPVDNDFAVCWLREHSLRRPLQIRQSDRIKAPLTYGVFRPVILLPKTIDCSDEVGLKVILAHEFTHIRRFDTLIKLVMTAAVCVHWFNPFVWVMYVLANRDIELSCDEAVVRTFGETMKSAYAMTLIGWEERKSSLAPLISGFAKNAIEERITAIMKIKKYTIPAVFVAILLVVGVTVAFATSNAAADNEDDAHSALEQALEEEDASSALKQVLEKMDYISTATISLDDPDYASIRVTLDGTDTLDKEQAAQIRELASYAFSDKSIKIICDGAVEGGDSSIVGWAVAANEVKYTLIPAYRFLYEEDLADTDKPSYWNVVSYIYGNHYIAAGVGDFIPAGVYVSDDGKACYVLDKNSDGTFTKTIYNITGRDYEDYEVVSAETLVDAETQDSLTTSQPLEVVAATPDNNSDVNNEVTALLGNEEWVWPAEGCDTVTSAFGKRVHPISGITTESDHICISGDNADGATVYAALAGTVLETGCNTEQGNYIIITHDNGIETSYRHLKETLVSGGDAVAAGDTIGTVGKTGDATGPCLAFCVYVDGVAVNPLEYYQ